MNTDTSTNTDRHRRAGTYIHTDTSRHTDGHRHSQRDREHRTPQSAYRSIWRISQLVDKVKETTQIWDVGNLKKKWTKTRHSHVDELQQWGWKEMNKNSAQLRWWTLTVRLKKQMVKRKLWQHFCFQNKNLPCEKGHLWRHRNINGCWVPIIQASSAIKTSQIIFHAKKTKSGCHDACPTD